ncbi:glycosyltransferase [Roseomonas sp. KE2513]|uniref:glycosyltransferase n=1 Tax=Roseomonas sp. KE2513 TaxID=2479202 RepID=UPI0018DF0113|nr:glycosyltransferase [Roseomonas sp. KE2513]MBI0536227.1 glycosyltransferase [Roseomonas sp. KE2513]
MLHVVHLLSGLEIGGKERAALRLARQGNRVGQRHALVLFDTPFRSSEVDFEPGDVPARFLKRGNGLDFRFAGRLAHLLRDMSADVVHAHNDTALFYAVLASTLRIPRRPRVVATFHTWPTHNSRGARALTRLAAHAATTVAVSEELSQRLIGTGWLSTCRTIWNGVELDRYSPHGPAGNWRRSLGLGDASVLVGHVARFDPIKRHADLIRAASLLRDRVPEVAFVLVGQGALKEEIRRQARDLPNVRFVRETPDIPALLRSLDLFVLCSSHEAAPLALLEAMACGIPPIITDVGGMPHIVGYGAAGLVVPPLRPDAIAGAIERLARDPQMRAGIGAAACAQAARFSFEAEWSAYSALYAGARPATTGDAA